MSPHHMEFLMFLYENGSLWGVFYVTNIVEETPEVICYGRSRLKLESSTNIFKINILYLNVLVFI